MARSFSIPDFGILWRGLPLDVFSLLTMLRRRYSPALDVEFPISDQFQYLVCLLYSSDILAGEYDEYSTVSCSR